MSAAPSWPLVIVALLGRAFQSAVLRPLPGFEFSSVFGPEAQFQGTQVLNSFFKPSERKTTSEALDCTRPSDRSLCGLQKPEIAYPPNDLRGTAAASRQAVFSCCCPDMGKQSWRFEGQVPE